MSVREALDAALARIRVRPAPSIDGRPLTTGLARSVYFQVYSRPRRPCDPEDAVDHAPLRAERGWEGEWQDGWWFVGRAGSKLRISRHGTEIAVPAHDLAPVHCEQIKPSPGVAVRRFRPGWDWDAGTWTMFGKHEARIGEGDRGIRAYWDLSVDGHLPLVRYICDRLDPTAPYTFKIMTGRVDRDRADAVVLYVPMWLGMPFVERLIAEAPKAVVDALRGGVPLGSRPVRPGVGVAWDPPGGESHGLRIARLLADAARAGDAPAARRAALTDLLAGVGLDPEHPTRKRRRPPLPDPPGAQAVADELRATGWMPSTGHVTVHARSRRNHAWHVVHDDGRAVFVKQLRTAGAVSARMREREATLLGSPSPLHAIAVPVLAELGPRLVLDSRASVVPLGEIGIPEATQLGTLLGRLHATPVDALPPGAGDVFDHAVAGILDAHRGGALVRWLSDVQRTFLANLPERVSGTLDLLARQWAPAAVIHGDVKHDNVVRWDDGLRLVDWELADRGDPAWDLGCAWWMCRTDATRDALLAAWVVAAGRPAPLTVRAYAIARGVQDAIEAMWGQPEPPPPSLDALDRVVALLPD